MIKRIKRAYWKISGKWNADSLLSRIFDRERNDTTLLGDFSKMMIILFIILFPLLILKSFIIAILIGFILCIIFLIAGFFVEDYWKLAIELTIKPLIFMFIVIYVPITFFFLIVSDPNTNPDLIVFIIGVGFILSPPLTNSLLFFYETRKNNRQEEYVNNLTVAVELNSFIYLIIATGTFALSPYLSNLYFLRPTLSHIFVYVLENYQVEFLNFIRFFSLPFLASNALLKFLLQRRKLKKERHKKRQEEEEHREKEELARKKAASEADEISENWNRIMKKMRNE